MAHCIWCSDSERSLLSERKTGVIHCPNSNFNLKSGVLNVRALLAAGIKVGLGTDVAGGSSPSMLDAIRQAVVASKLVEAGMGNITCNESETLANQKKALSYTEAFYLATLGSARCLGLENKIGNFKVGKEFDALVVNVHAPNGPIDAPENESPMDSFQRFLFIGDDRNITRVFVKGKQVI